MSRILVLFALITFLAVACATSQPEPEQPAEETPVAQPAPAAPEPEPAPVVAPPAAPAPEVVAERVTPPPPTLPETASQLPLLALAGLGSLGLGGLVHALRRWLP